MEEGGRRRSTRLAAKGVATPKMETPAKKTVVKSSEKPKRTKRKTFEEEIDLPDLKKAKSEEPASSDETDKPEENKVNNVEPNDVPKDGDKDVVNDEPAVVEDEEDAPASDSSKEDEKFTTAVAASDEKETADVSSAEEEQLADIKEEKEEKEVVVKEEKKNEEEVVVAVEQPKTELSPEKSVPVVAENVNGNSDAEKEVEPVKGIAKNDNGLCVAAKDTITSNGDTDVQINSANGDKSVLNSETVEPIKVLHDNTNHVAENDLKVVTSPTTVNTTSNDLSGIEQDGKEQDKVVDSAVDVVVSSSDNVVPSVEQPSTVVS